MNEDRLLKWYKIGCWLMSAKYVYYCSPKNIATPSDTFYDQIEEEYKKLSKELDLPSFVSDIVGWDSTLGEDWPTYHKLTPSAKFIEYIVDKNNMIDYELLA